MLSLKKSLECVQNDVSTINRIQSKYCPVLIIQKVVRGFLIRLRYNYVMDTRLWWVYYSVFWDVRCRIANKFYNFDIFWHSDGQIKKVAWIKYLDFQLLLQINFLLSVCNFLQILDSRFCTKTMLKKQKTKTVIFVVPGQQFRSNDITATTKVFRILLLRHRC